MTEKRYEVAVYDDKAINGYCVLDKYQASFTARLGYKNVFISSEYGCEIVARLLNDKEHTINEMAKTIRIYDDGYIDLNKKYKKVVDENEQLKKKILEEIDLEVAYVNETYSDGRMSKEQHNGAIISLRQLREKFE